ncbi:MAG: 4Fe-4S ferredoxin [Candidatus Omnitrophica bacterium]|nr:4Fe-4S ferredoxin [Candidatus Omnitrophota bacterium]
MPKRKIIKIDEEKCNGCGLCIPNCPEGAIQVIDGKARLISDLFCDGLGACIGHCPQGAIAIEEREAEKYDERKVMENIVRQGENTIIAHLAHLKEHDEEGYLKEAMQFLKEKHLDIPLESGPAHHVHGHAGCPGAKITEFKKRAGSGHAPAGHQESGLEQWPIQLALVPAFAPFLNDADLLIAADCVPFAYASFHRDLLRGKVLLVGCPKFDDTQLYSQKLTQMFQNNRIKSVTYAHMEVPCCSGLTPLIQSAITASGKEIPFRETVISIKGERSE